MAKSRFDGLEGWEILSRADIYNYWLRMGMGRAPLAWEYVPEIAGRAVDKMMLLTADFKMFKLDSHKEFYRIMFRENEMLLVFEDNTQLSVIEVYSPIPTWVAENPIPSKSPFRRLVEAVTSAPPFQGPDQNNVVPFRPKKK